MTVRSAKRRSDTGSCFLDLAPYSLCLLNFRSVSSNRMAENKNIVIGLLFQVQLYITMCGCTWRYPCKYHTNCSWAQIKETTQKTNLDWEFQLVVQLGYQHVMAEWFSHFHDANDGRVDLVLTVVKDALRRWLLLLLLQCHWIRTCGW